MTTASLFGQLRKRIFFSLLGTALIAPALLAQAPSPNADILKMIQAGLPEDVIVGAYS